MEESCCNDFEISPDIHVPSVSQSAWHVFSLSRESGYFIPRSIQTVFSGLPLRAATFKCPPVFDSAVPSAFLRVKERLPSRARVEGLANRDHLFAWPRRDAISFLSADTRAGKQPRWPMIFLSASLALKADPRVSIPRLFGGTCVSGIKYRFSVLERSSSNSSVLVTDTGKRPKKNMR